MSPSRPNYFAGLTRNTFLLATGSFFADVSTEMLYPILPIFLTQTLQASGSIVGLIEGVAQATQNIVQGISGSLSDRLRKHKTIAMVGFIAAALAKPLFGLATAWEGVLGARLLDRIGTGTRSAPRDALVAESVDEQHRGRAFGLEGFGDNAGAFIGPLLTIALLFWLQADIRAIFFLAVIPGLLAFAMVALVRERSTTVTAEVKIDISPRRLPASYWKYLLVTMIFGIGNSSNSFLILQTRDIGVSLPLTILIYALFNLTAALISYPAGFMSDRWGRKNLLLAAYLVFVVTYLGFAMSRDVTVVAVAFAGYGLFQGMFRAVGKAFASDFAPAGLRASAVGWYNTTVGLLGLFASVVAGMLWDRVGHEAVFFYGAASAVAGCIALLTFIAGPPGRSADLGKDAAVV
ncbi:MAG: MFS transporter [Alphaproteobacteria bacterium]|nr:MFS transporter [Alphaproteobacteria bacterium]